MKITTKIEGPRGCGYRQPGGLYLVSGQMAEPCHRLPWVLEVCPVCKAGIKPSRAWTWVDGVSLFSPGCKSPEGPRREPLTHYDIHCERCIICNPSLLDPQLEGRESGLIWVGEKFYRTAHEFTVEAAAMGISRRITAIPRGFKIGETWVFLAHRKGQVDLDFTVGYIPAIFGAYKPERIEYVVKGDETDDQLEAMVKRGITPVKVEKAGENGEIFE